ncbi:Alpha/Beta hydrolase protein [Cadophora sp. MPI-SDFR-AT-0126]|nr:Alpha/Beta hydrolase protein [Leotiomycetes sp. MPI-SDFR-AT-0126]
MAEFSRFGGVSDDWTAYIAAHPQPPPAPDLTPVQLQERTNAGREANSREILNTITIDIETRDFTCVTSDNETIPLRVYKPSSTPASVKLPVFIFYHGGGYCFGTLSSEDGFCSWIVEQVGIVVVNVCYRHTPQWKWPAQREDAFNSLNWVFDNIESLGGDEKRVFVGGRSSGSNLAAGITLRDTETGSKRIKGLILDLPHVCHTDVFPSELIAAGKDSFAENIDAPILPSSRIKFFNELLDVKDPGEKYYSVLLASKDELAKFPPTHFLVAGRDALRDEALLFEEKLRQSGIKTEINIYSGVPHGFRRFGELQASRQYDHDLVDAFAWLLKQ